MEKTLPALNENSFQESFRADKLKVIRKEIGKNLAGSKSLLNQIRLDLQKRKLTRQKSKVVSTYKAPMSVHTEIVTVEKSKPLARPPE